MPHTVEEAYEVADAAIARDDAKLADELGDLLFQVYFLALLLEEKGSSGLEEIARAVHAKLVRRHPHVFGECGARHRGRVRELVGEQQARPGRPRGDLPRRSRSRCPRCSSRGRCSGAPQRSTSNIQTPPGALADLDDELRELKEALAEAGETPPETEPPSARVRGDGRRTLRRRQRRASPQRRPGARACERCRDGSSSAWSAPSVMRKKRVRTSRSSG